MVIVTTTFRQPGQYPAIARGFFVSGVPSGMGRMFTRAMTPPNPPGPQPIIAGLGMTIRSRTWGGTGLDWLRGWDCTGGEVGLPCAQRQPNGNHDPINAKCQGLFRRCFLLTI